MKICFDCGKGIKIGSKEYFEMGSYYSDIDGSYSLCKECVDHDIEESSKQLGGGIMKIIDKDGNEWKVHDTVVEYDGYIVFCEKLRSQLSIVTTVKMTEEEILKFINHDNWTENKYKMIYVEEVGKK